MLKKQIYARKELKNIIDRFLKLALKK